MRPYYLQGFKLGHHPTLGVCETLSDLQREGVEEDLQGPLFGNRLPINIPLHHWKAYNSRTIRNTFHNSAQNEITRDTMLNYKEDYVPAGCQGQQKEERKASCLVGITGMKQSYKPIQLGNKRKKIQSTNFLYRKNIHNLESSRPRGACGHFIPCKSSRSFK